MLIVNFASGQRRTGGLLCELTPKAANLVYPHRTVARAALAISWIATSDGLGSFWSSSQRGDRNHPPTPSPLHFLQQTKDELERQLEVSDSTLQVLFCHMNVGRLLKVFRQFRRCFQGFYFARVTYELKSGRVVHMLHIWSWFLYIWIETDWTDSNYSHTAMGWIGELLELPYAIWSQALYFK